MNTTVRDNSIDILRFIGLMLIILSHASPSVDSIVQLRCFDVPMMLFISGLTCSNKEFPDYRVFIKRRTLRLIAPVYIFLTFYFIILAIVQHLGIIPKYLTIGKVAESFLLLNGIGYVWIIRVFLLIMLVTPLLCKVGKLSNSIVLITMVILLSLCEIIVHITNNPNIPNIISIVLKEYIIYILAYSVPFLLGYKLRYYNKHTYIFWAVASSLALIIGIIIYIYNLGLPINISPYFKYPPQTYFIIYGVFSSTIMWMTKEWWVKRIDFRLVQFIGQNTIWIYLWHIPFVLLCNQFIDNWYIRYILLICAPVLIFSVQYKLVQKINIIGQAKKFLIG